MPPDFLLLDLNKTSIKVSTDKSSLTGYLKTNTHWSHECGVTRCHGCVPTRAQHQCTHVLTPDHWFYLLLLLLFPSVSTITLIDSDTSFHFFFFSHNFQLPSVPQCKHVDNKQQCTKRDGQRDRVCARVSAGRCGPGDEKQLSATWLAYLDEHTALGFHWTLMHRWAGDRFPASRKHTRLWAENNQWVCSATTAPYQVECLENGRVSCRGKKQCSLHLFSFHFARG